MANLKLLIPISFWALMLYSCKEISFKEPQPLGNKPLKEMPDELKGKYLAIDKTNGEKNDTLIIESWGYRMKDKDDKDWLGKGTLGDSLVVKFYRNYYFINFRSGGQWVLRLIKRKPAGDLELLSIDLEEEAKRKTIIAKLSNRFGIKELKKGDDLFYQINPTRSQLIQLIDQGYFTGGDLKKIK